MNQTLHRSTEARLQMDSINRRAWSARSTVESFRRRKGWTDAGEQAALEHVREDAIDRPILDLGVGAGRTVPMLLSISHDYVGIDYTPALARACRRAHPEVRILQGDAPDLSKVPDASFQLVVLSFNGIDAVAPADRILILREAHRVLRTGGAFLFSTHNRSGPGHGEKLHFGVDRTRDPLKLAGRCALALLHAARTTRNYRRYSKLREDGRGYSIRNASAHDYGILVHYITLESQLKQLESVGFRPYPLAWASSDGRRISRGDDTSDVWWFHLVARK